MALPKPSKRQKVFSALAAGCLASIIVSLPALADSRPYFRGYGADVFAGGGFNSGPSSCNPSDSNYQAPNYSGPSNLYRGGVMAFASYNSGTQKAKGAGVDFGAVALGLIEGNNSGSGEPYGFASGTTGYNRTSFANQSTISATNYWGGFLEGTVRQTHCIPDYFGTKQSSPSSISSAGDVSALGSGQYIATPGGILNVGAGSPIAAGKRITLFVSGDVFIGSNITYASRSTYTADNPPKFALVVKGNIYISPSVGALDGLYIAQPGANPSTSGFIWTCHNNDTLEPNNIFVSSSCRSKLTVNGAFIAKKLQLLRANGDQAASVADEPASSGNIAEVFNFTPEMVVGGGFFNQPGATSNKIQSLISLPPVF